jgi:hypothetical protein
MSRAVLLYSEHLVSHRKYMKKSYTDINPVLERTSSDMQVATVSPYSTSQIKVEDTRLYLIRLI